MSVQVSGTMKWFNPSKGFGFFSCDNGIGDVFVHSKQLRSDGFANYPLDGAKVRAEVDRSERGLIATRMIEISGPMLPLKEKICMAAADVTPANIVFALNRIAERTVGDDARWLRSAVNLVAEMNGKLNGAVSS